MARRHVNAYNKHRHYSHVSIGRQGFGLAGDWKSRPPLASSKADLRRLGVEPAKAGFAVVAAAKRAVAGLQKLDGHPLNKAASNAFGESRRANRWTSCILLEPSTQSASADLASQRGNSFPRAKARLVTHPPAQVWWNQCH